MKSQYDLLRKKGLPDLHNNDLLRACKQNDELLAIFLQENKDFIFYIISQYKGNIETLKEKFNVTEEELLQHGYIGMITAIKTFDFDRGIKFTTYVLRPILWEVNQLLYNDSRLVRLSRSAIDLVKRMEEVESGLGYFPQPEAMAKELDTQPERIEEILRFATDLLYIDSMDYFELSNSEESHEDDITVQVYVQDLLESSGLVEFEKQVASLIMEGLNNSQIAEKLGVYPMTINRTIERIKSKFEDDFDDRRISKYEKEIDIIAEEIEELNKLLDIAEMRELLEVCGFDVDSYTSRVLYYIRQKALKRVPPEILKDLK